MIQAFANILFYHEFIPQKTTALKDTAENKQEKSVPTKKDAIVNISSEGRELLKNAQIEQKIESKSDTNKLENELSKEEQKQVEELKARDVEVRAHEQAHLRAAGKYAASGTKFEYSKGPDGKQYVVGGHVDIDTSEIPNDPEATIQKAQVIIKAANAPMTPSSKDKQIAAQAAQMEAKAHTESINQNKDEGAVIPEYPNSVAPPQTAANPYTQSINAAAQSIMNFMI